MVATVAVLGVLHLRNLRGRYIPVAPAAPHDQTMLIVASSVCVVLGPAFVSGITPAIPATAAALVLVGTALVRNRPLLRSVKVPWVTIWASLATILWRERCRRAGISISMWRLAWQGTLCATAATVAATLALSLS